MKQKIKMLRDEILELDGICEFCDKCECLECEVYESKILFNMAIEEEKTKWIKKHIMLK